MPRRTRHTAVEKIDTIKKLIKNDPTAGSITEEFRLLCRSCINHLATATKLDCVSLVADKEYFYFSKDGKRSRPVNKALYSDLALAERFLDAVRSGTYTEDVTAKDITHACYTLIMSFACVVDLEHPRNKKTPGSYYEYLITHLLCRFLHATPIGVVVDMRHDIAKMGQDVEPEHENEVEVIPDLEEALEDSEDQSDETAVETENPLEVEEITLPTDLVLSVDETKPLYHLAIKNSTRERGAEIWIHQKVLDLVGQQSGVEFSGIFMGLAETKMDTSTFEVVEICVPNQWRIYQQYVAEIDSFYYLDPPEVYLALKNRPPYINVKAFGEFFFDYAAEGPTS